MSSAALKRSVAPEVAPPLDEATLMRCMVDWTWRITAGHIYKIKAKVANDDGDTAGLEIPFTPNVAQRMLLDDLHNRNVILKARQMGFSTLIEVMALDHALFNADQNVVVIAQSTDAAEELFRDKIKYAYDRLPKAMKDLMPLKKETQSQLVFAHNDSSIRVTTSARGGTVHFLHVSEMGKIAAKFPDKAREITTGSLQAVPATGLAFIESTAEGQDGAFYEIARRAEAKRLQLKRLTPADYHFHFFAWWMDPGYTMDPTGVIITLKQHDYFDEVEDKMGCVISLGQRAWYVTKQGEDFAHEPDLMWREYPSTPDECWKSGTEGKYLARIIQRMRADGRIGNFPIVQRLPANTFWDLGGSDDNVCWVHQRVESWDRWVDYREESGTGLLPFILWLDTLGVSFDTHYLPHDASHVINGVEQPTSIISQCRALRPSWTWRIVPRVANIQHGIDLLRADTSTWQMHEATCKPGIAHLENYSREFNTRLQTWTNAPRHDEHSHAADAIRQKAQGYSVSAPTPKDTRTRAQRSGLAV